MPAQLVQPCRLSASVARPQNRVGSTKDKTPSRVSCQRVRCSRSTRQGWESKQAGLKLGCLRTGHGGPEHQGCCNCCSNGAASLVQGRSASIVAGSCGCRGGRGCRRVRCRLCLLQCRIFRGEESHRQLWANINLLRAPIYANWTHRQREGTQRETQRDTANRAHGLEKVIPPSKARCSCGAPSTPPSTLANRRRSVTGEKC